MDDAENPIRPNSAEPKPRRPRAGNRSLEERAKAAKDAEERARVRFLQKQAKAKRYEAALSQRARKLDTRRKIIAGALALEHMKQDAVFRAALMKLLNEYVTRDIERSLFGLPPLPPDARPME